MDAKYGDAYRELFEKHWWWRSRTEFIVEKIRQLQPASGWKRILDIGCGDALFFDRLADFGEVEGVEPASDLVNPEGPHRERIYVGPFDTNFRPGKQYSLALMLDVLEHLDDPVAALRHALELLTPDGIAIITVPAFMTLWTNHDALNHHRTRYTKTTFRRVAQQAGLKIEEERYLYHWTCPVKLGVRVAEKIFPSRPETPRVPVWFVNEPLYVLSRLEQKTISALPMPFGSSLLVVGRRADAG